MPAWAEIIASVGFPIAAACALFYFMIQILNTHKEEMELMRQDHREEVKGLEKALIDNTYAIMELRTLINERITN